MRAAALLLLAFGGGLVGLREQIGTRFSAPQTPPVQIAMGNGTGFNTACQGTTPALGRGVTVTVGRTTLAYCNKKGAAVDAGLVPGDLVLTDAGLLRIEPGADGVLGIRTDPAISGTPLAAGSGENFQSDAGWSAFSGGGAATPHVIADQAVAPDGQTTADLLCWGSTTGSQDSTIRYSLGFTGGTTPHFLSVYLMAADGGTVTVGAGGVAGQYAPFAVNGTSYVRAYHSSQGQNQSNFYIGCSSSTQGGTACTGGCVYAWGAQREGTRLSSYSPNGSTSSTARTDEGVSFTLPQAVGPDFCLGATFSTQTDGVGGTILRLGTTTSQLASVGRGSGTTALFTIQAASSTPTVGWSPAILTPDRLWLCDIGGTRTAGARQGGTTVSLTAPAGSLTDGKTTVTIGTATAGPVGIVSKIQVTPSPALLIK